MKKFTVLEVNNLKNEALIVAEIEAKNEKAARIEAFAKYNMYISAGCVMAVASDNRYEQFYSEMVEATERKMR